MVQLTLSGDPASIRASGVVWNTFGTDAGTAVADIRTLQTDECKGQELVDLVKAYKDGLPPRLEKVRDAWTKVGAALTTYAGTLESLQSRMQSVALRHGNAQTAVSNASTALGSAQRADSSHAQSRKSQQQLLEPGEKLPPDGYVSQVGAKQTALTNAQTALRSIEGEAAQIIREHEAAVRTLTGEINTAKGLRPDDPPNWLEKKWQGVKDFVTKHADVLKKISGVLKIVSMIAGALSFIPFLAPIMGPIALATGALALGIDVLLKVTGNGGSWSQIGLDALGLIPGVKGLTALRSAKMFSEGAKFAKVGSALTKMDDAKVAMGLVEHFGSVTAAGLTGYQYSKGEKSLTDVLLATAGVKMPMSSDKVKNIQNLVVNGGGTANQTSVIVDKIRNGKPVTVTDWTKLGTSAFKTGTTGRNMAAYRSAGRQPDGTERKAGDNASYTIKDTKQAISRYAAGSALSLSLRRGPVAQTPPVTPTSEVRPASASAPTTSSVRGPFAPGQRVAPLPSAPAGPPTPSTPTTQVRGPFAPGQRVAPLPAAPLH